MGKNTDPGTLKKAVNRLLGMLNVGRDSQISKFFRALMGIDNIPDTLQEAVNTLLGRLSAEQRAAILAGDETQFQATFHFGMGLWMRNHWVYPAKTGWFGVSRHAKVDPDRISGFVCRQLCRAVHGKAISDRKVCPSWMDNVDE